MVVSNVFLSRFEQKRPIKKRTLSSSPQQRTKAGSTVLRWESDLPLETADSGVITFRCRVR